MSKTSKLINRLDALLDRLEPLLPEPPPAPLKRPVPLMRWRRRGAAAALEPARRSQDLRLNDLQCLDRQKALIQANTEQFINGFPANNVLLWGPRGTGKSSLVRALLHEYQGRGLHLVEIARDDLPQLADACDAVRRFQGRFILYCDDMSFDAGDPGYKTLKVMLDGSLDEMPANVLVYATSNRRHLVPEFKAENLGAAMLNGEIHQNEAAEEKLSLSERFGVRLSFHPFNQEQYLCIVQHWLRRLNAPPHDEEQVRQAALQWALEKGARNGRSAVQFARHWVGNALLSGK